LEFIVSKSPADVPTVRSNYDGTTLTTQIPPQELKRLIAGGGLVLLKGAFPTELLRNILEKVFAWGQECGSQRESEVSFHRIDNRPPQSQTSHAFHAYNFQLRREAISAEMDKLIRPIFTAMGNLQNAIAGTQASYEPDAAGQFFHPQIIQYPSGGGFFDEHVHPLEPQRVGLILGLSEKGLDFKEGGTCFRVKEGNHSFEDSHAMGDIILFRYDLPHWITPIDHDEPLDWCRQAGRWTMVLPYY